MTIIALLIAAGGAIVVQNLIMAEISSGASTPIVAMALNALVGVSLLLALLAFRTGAAGFGELSAAVGWRNLVPGLLGTFFVFASLVGYQRLGAGTTISVLVASQLIGGLIADAIRTDGARLSAPTLIGAAMLGVGTLLVARG
ncbi:DMT family transporter [Pleomorphomonas sp. JP5]|uniref:DMT family transporter n=1 Tax=Pleomorphomonas sp. JP5 TaxID=2942998 RepID=UPI0020445036|nr:DMT family transporter [Pleomorphomonas sp. JP5]MCM5557476.1 DMT family transporter [Pleomorphomonas sp. JP5]